MASKATITAAIGLGRKNADRVIRSRTIARKRRARALRENRRAFSMLVQLTTAKGSETFAKLQTAGFLAAAGDSWFAYPWHDVLKDLEDNYGYNVESTANAGDPVEQMAYQFGQIDDFGRKLDKIKDLGAVPRAALLSGGGDDIAGKEFGMLLNSALSPIAGWNKKIVDSVLDDRIRTALVTMISSMDHLIRDRFKKSLPILVHGYDYPVPDGRGYIGAWGHYFLGPWLEPGFREKHFDALPQRIQMMHDTIDQFNTMLRSLARQFPFLYYVNVRNTLSTVLPKDYKRWWDNELHPTKAGFEKVTDKFAAVLQKLP
jgi:hypothetical protein